MTDTELQDHVQDAWHSSSLRVHVLFFTRSRADGHSDHLGVIVSASYLYGGILLVCAMLARAL